MNRKILLFSILRERVGDDHVLIDSANSITAGELLDLFIIKYPEFTPLKLRIKVAVNKKVVLLNSIIPDDAEIAFFPPVSGG